MLTSINIDSIRLPDEVAILTGEMMSFVNFDKFLIAQTKNAFQAKNIPVKKGSLPMGGTDAIPFQQKNIPSLSIIGINMKKLDPTYHTRLDVIDNVDQKALDNVKIALTEFIHQWDKM
jgi:putative aminopeptidase FrvX